MTVIKATVHSAISIVNAIATGKGAALGISKKVNVEIEASKGNGIIIESKNKHLSSRLINKVIEKTVPKNEFSKTKFRVYLNSEIPTGYGLKSSSAVSSAVSMCCAKLFKPKMTDFEILASGVDASIETKVSLTGAYDDACACYYGGFVVTDNYKRKIICSERCQTDISAIIFIPKSRKRGNVKKLRTLSNIFEEAWNIAKGSDYWNAMKINGLATSIILNSDPKIIFKLIEEGACIRSFRLVENGIFNEDGISELLLEPGRIEREPGENEMSGARNLADNISDLKAQAAANQRGIDLLLEMVEHYSLETVQAYMEHIQENAEQAVRSMLKDLSLRKGLAEIDSLEAEDHLDDGSPIRLKITINRNDGSAIFDFSGTGPELWGNLNTPLAVTNSAILYSCLLYTSPSPRD